MANSETAEVDSECHKSKATLLGIFKSYKCTLDKLNDLAEQSDAHIDQNENEDNEVLDNTKNDLISFIDNIFKKALSTCESNEEISDTANFYFCSEFTKNFQNLCYTFPTWTNCIKTYFSSPNQIGSSTRSEANFKDAKKRVPRPILAQKYILKDKKRIKALTHFAFSRLPKKLDTEKQIVNVEEILNLDLASFHNI